MKSLSAFVALFAMLAAGACNYTIEDSTVFLPREHRSKAASPDEMRLFGEANLFLPGGAPARIEHRLVEAGGLRLALTQIGDGAASRPLFVFCMGNASDRIGEGVYYANRALGQGDVLLFDYPGYGDSTGVAGTPDLLAARPALLAAIAETGEGRSVIFWGQSLGGFICADLAMRAERADGLVLETSAISAEAVAEAWEPWYLPFLDVRVDESLRPFNTPETLKGFEAPILVIGAGRDDVLPTELHRDLADALEANGHAVTYVEFPLASHMRVPAQPGFADAVATFTDQVLSDSAP